MAILALCPGAAKAAKPGWEAVFSSTGFRIRAAQPTSTIDVVACWVESAVASLFFTLFPADCRICGSPLVQVSRLPVCSNCLGSLRPQTGSFCCLCGEALPGATFTQDGIEDHVKRHGIGDRCRLCQTAQPPFERAVAFGSYEGSLRDLVHLLKFDQVRPVAQVLGRMLAESMRALEPSLPAGTIVVVPVPLHRHKLSQRGFNQAELIFRAAHKQLLRREEWKGRFKFFPGILTRVRDTGSQVGLTRHQRRQNLRGAFTVKDATPILHRGVLLVDDVYTTGATASECARVLRRAGASHVWVATVGRTQRISNFF